MGTITELGRRIARHTKVVPCLYCHQIAVRQANSLLPLGYDPNLVRFHCPYCDKSMWVEERASRD